MFRAAYAGAHLGRSPLSNRGLAMVAGLGLLLNAAILFIVLPTLLARLGANYHSNMFPDLYDLIAQNLLDGRGYRIFPDTSLTMLRSPGFVLVLAGIFAAFGKSLLAVQVIQFLMSAATAVIVYLIAQRLFANQLVSLAAAALFLFHPITMVAETRGGDDTTLTLCFTATLWFLLRAIDTRSMRDFLIVGLAFGWTMLVKPSVALVLPAVGLFLLLGPKPDRFSFVLVRNFAIAGGVAALLMAPWVLRNFEISGKFVPTMTVGGLAAFQGAYVVSHEGNGENNSDLLQDAANQQTEIAHQMGLKMEGDFYPQFYKVGDEVKFYNALGRQAVDEYRASPTLLARAIIHNSWAFWMQGRTHKATLLNVLIMAPFLLLSVYGATIAVRTDWRCWILVISAVAFLAPNLVIIAVDRHCSSVLPLMCIFAAAGLLTPGLAELFERRRPVAV